MQQTSAQWSRLTPLTVWRIGMERFASQIWNGVGAAVNGGRWNCIGQRVVYASPNLSLAAWEVFVGTGLRPSDFRWVAAKAVIPSRLTGLAADPRNLPNNWRDDEWRQDGTTTNTQKIGTDWLQSAPASPPILVVPSAVFPDELNYILNPMHPDFTKIQFAPAEPFEFDPRITLGLNQFSQLEVERVYSQQH